MMDILQVCAGIVLGVLGIGAVFWFTFRRLPPRRHVDSMTAVNPNADAENFIQSMNIDGQSHF